MRVLARLFWFLPCLVVACDGRSVRDPSPDGGDSTGGVRGAGGHVGDDGPPAGGGPTGGSVVTGGMFGVRGDIGVGGSIGAGGAAGVGGYAGAGGYYASGGYFGAGGYYASGGYFGGDGAWASGGLPGTGGANFAGGAFGSGGRAVDPVCCEAIPFCRAGYDQVSGPGECVKGDICYEATACCSTIWCKAHEDHDAGVCAAGAPPNVRYISANASVCDRRAWTCIANTYQYWDTCGCGCSQDPGCPASVGCRAVPNDPLCTDTAICPYTTRD
jgi:hypothetical protein